MNINTEERFFEVSSTESESNNNSLVEYDLNTNSIVQSASNNIASTVSNLNDAMFGNTAADGTGTTAATNQSSLVASLGTDGFLVDTDDQVGSPNAPNELTRDSFFGNMQNLVEAGATSWREILKRMPAEQRRGLYPRKVHITTIAPDIVDALMDGIDEDEGSFINSPNEKRSAKEALETPKKASMRLRKTKPFLTKKQESPGARF